VPPLLIGAACVHHAYGAVDPEPFQPPLQDLEHPFGARPFAVELLALLADLTVLALLIACIGGALALESQDGHGTIVEAVVPCGS
jgi:hypothetical protein